MRNVLTIIGKELRSYFVSPVAYVVLTGFLLLGGWFFFNLLSRFSLLLTLYLQFQGAQGAEAANRLNLNGLVSHRITANELGTAYEGLLKKKEEYLGVVVKW